MIWSLAGPSVLLLGLVFAASASAASGPVCGNAAYAGDNGLSAPGQQWQSRYIYYCPQGATTIQLMFAGAYAAGQPPVERQLVDPQVLDLSVEIFVPPVWQPNVAYAVGAQVSAPVTAPDQGGTYAALAANTATPPTAANRAVWRPTTATPVPISCRGSRPCVLGTTEAGGKTVTDAFLVTDPIAVDIKPGSLIALRAWISQTGAQVMANGPSQTARAGSYLRNSAVEPDLTLAGGRIPGGPAHHAGPFAIVGQQNVARPVPSVCILGDSRVAGVAGLGLNYPVLVYGGHGYVADDIGRLVANVDAGGGGAADRIAPIVYAIQNVSAGQVTQLGVYDPGQHVPSPNAAPPVGSQATGPVGLQPGTTGSGLVVGIAASGQLSAAAGLVEDPRTFAQGFLQKGLSDAGIPFTSFSHSSDFVHTWVSPGGDALRLPAIQKSGCSSVVIGLGLLDATFGPSLARLQSDLVTLARQLLALGTVRGVYLVTVAPQTASRDDWATALGQSVFSHEAVRVALNDWERTVPPPFAGTFDAAAPVEVNAANVVTRDGGFWIANGVPHYATVEGTHLSPGSAALAAGAITARASILQ